MKRNMSRQELDALLARALKPHCSMCIADPKVFCNRDVDTICIQCDGQFCAGHIQKHMEDEHQITSSMGHCSKK